MLCGVPQGSVLGPCLFLLYTNDLHESLSSNAGLFADDIIAYLTIKLIARHMHSSKRS